MKLLIRSWRIALDAYRRFNANYGWAIASHIALSTLMSLFPFLILVTAIAGFIDSKDLADEVVRILFEAWPAEVANPIAAEMRKVLTNARGDLLTVGVVLSIYFASSGIESVRIGLNRAYNGREPRSWWKLQLESISYVVLGAIALLAVAFLIVLGPLMFAAAERYVPWLAPFSPVVSFLRIGVGAIVLIVTLLFVHKWLPAGHRSLKDIIPGVLFTLVAWLLAGEAFGRYLAHFAYTYVSYYAGLASPMIVLVFLYLTSSIFIYGGELNAAIRDARKKSAR